MIVRFLVAALLAAAFVLCGCDRTDNDEHRAWIAAQQHVTDTLTGQPAEFPWRCEGAKIREEGGAWIVDSYVDTVDQSSGQAVRLQFSCRARCITSDWWWCDALVFSNRTSLP